MMTEFAAKPVRIFVVWEPVLFTDWLAPSTATLGRISHERVTQFWDKDRLVSHSLGEHDRRRIVWDYIAVYPRSAVWEASPPQPLYSGRPVIGAVDEAHSALSKALNEVQAQQEAAK